MQSNCNNLGDTLRSDDAVAGIKVSEKVIEKSTTEGIKMPGSVISIGKVNLDGSFTMDNNSNVDE